MIYDSHQISEFLTKLVWSLFLLICPLFDPKNRLYWSYTLSSLILIFVVYLLCEAKTAGISLKKVILFAFPKSLYTQKSAILDYQTYLINGLLKIIVALTSLFTLSQTTAEFIRQFLYAVFGPSEIHLEANYTVRLIYTILDILVLDFSAFFSHYLLHKVPILWEFHQVHHSAEGLNFITSFRDHPIDVAFKQSFRALFLGIFMGICNYFLSEVIDPFKMSGVLISTFLFTFIINLRHSHIWISYGWHLNHILFSPAMHQIHHSSKEEHIDKNLGLIFSFWDYLFGTLYVPRVREEFSVGLVEQSNYDNIWQLYYYPFVKVLRRIVKFRLGKKDDSTIRTR